MNERLMELAVQSNLGPACESQAIAIKKFAELIVKEYEKLLPETCPWADADKEGPMKGWCNEVDNLSKKVKQGLRAMGCPTGSSTAFSKYGDDWRFSNKNVQGMRYMWLKWAAMIAEEQGV